MSRASSVSYFHVELDSHDAILAEGAWAESFVDCDSRGMFINAARNTRR
ncbi:MAG: Hint domain-containing protein [Alphaproteobacteria bacterium]|nr:Hint domain-containing protein [Alphaproteobacteria bacterium]